MSVAGRWRVAIGGFAQETNSFTGIATTLADFSGRGGELRRGDDVVDAHRGVNTVLGGFIDELAEAGHQVRPTLAARACPGGPLEASAYHSLRDELVDALATESADAVLLSLHGAMVAEGTFDPEADIVKRVRALDPDCPVIVVLDMHANVSAELAEAATAIVGYRTYPHVDMAECGRRAVRVLGRVGLEARSVHTSYRRLPLQLPSINMRTDDGQGPMAVIQQDAASCAVRDDALLDVAVFAGFPYADVPCSHASVVAYALGRAAAADAAADVLADQLWNARHAFDKPTVPARDAVRDALASHERPFVLADVADNPGSGGTGETTTLLRLLIDHGAENAFVGILHDPETVERAFATPVGTSARFRIGGKIEPGFGAPVEVDATVEAHSDGEYVCAGPMLRGKKECLGRSALLRAGGVLVGVTEGRASVNDPNMLTMLGIDPREPRVLALKVKGHFRAAFGSLVARIVDAEAPGAAMTDFTRLTYRHLERPLHPFDALERWRTES